jgi:hypothetical protein
MAKDIGLNWEWLMTQRTLLISKRFHLHKRSLKETKRPIFEGAYRKAHCDDNVQAVYAPAILKRIFCAKDLPRCFRQKC